MQKLNKLLILFLVLGITTSCFEDLDDNAVTANEINDFIWKGLNAFYLYKDDVPDLANDRFTTNEEYAQFLNSFSTPESIFDTLLSSQDRFSIIVPDYIALEQIFSGVSMNNGMEYGLRRYCESCSEVFGYVRYVLPNSDAEAKGVQRGDIFYAIDGTQLTDTNFSSLLSPETYTINLATYDNNGTPDTADDSVIPETESITLTKMAYTENPVFKTEILNAGGDNVGYLMYNGFTADFDTQLNAAFSSFQTNNVTDLILDLRYNPGGSVNSAVLLSSLITGQFTGDVLVTEQWNSDLQAAFEAQNPESLIYRFVDNDEGTGLNSLNLNRVYVLTTGNSASASELVINGLNPYVNVVQIGTNTSGKYQASFTVYDSPDFRRQNANPNHAYAMQPLVLKVVNSVGFTDFDNGLTPDIILPEDYGNLGVLGDPNEPLLEAALNDITGSRYVYPAIETLPSVGDSNGFTPLMDEMYIERELPEDIIKRLNF